MPGPRVDDERDTLPPGAILLGRYRIERELGRGGMAVVYAASHITIGATVAIKVLHASLAARRAAADRFLTEARAIAAVQHPNVVRVSDYGELSDGRPFLVMEYLQGHDLGRELEQTSPLPWSTLRPLVLQVCAGLQAAHDVGIVHCDVKPQNIFLLDAGAPFARVKVLDFGIAKLGDALRGGRHEDPGGERAFVGTPDYMAPEQSNGGEIDARADIYSLGITLYRALTGRLPFTSRHWFATVTQHLYRPPMPPRALEPSIPAAVEALILRALEKRPSDRFASMRDLAEAAAATPDESCTSTATATIADPGTSMHARGRGIAIGASAIAALTAGLWWGWSQLGPEHVEEAPPRPEPVEAVRAATPAAPPPDRPRVAAQPIEPPPIEPTPTEPQVEAPAVLIPPPPPLVSAESTPKRSARVIRHVAARVDRVPPPQPLVAAPMPEPDPAPTEPSRLRIEEVKNPFD